MKKIFLTMALSCFLSSAAFAQSPEPASVDRPVERAQIKGLVKVDVQKRDHWWQRAPRSYTYEQTDGSKVVYSHKLRKTPDLRPYEEQKASWVKAQTGCKRWEPVVQVVAQIAVPVALFLAPLVKSAFHF